VAPAWQEFSSSLLAAFSVAAFCFLRIGKAGFSMIDLVFAFGTLSVPLKRSGHVNPAVSSLFFFSRQTRSGSSQMRDLSPPAARSLPPLAGTYPLLFSPNCRSMCPCRVFFSPTLSQRTQRTSSSARLDFRVPIPSSWENSKPHLVREIPPSGVGVITLIKNFFPLYLPLSRE